MALFEHLLGLARGRAKKLIELRIGHRECGAISEVIEIEAEGAILLHVNELVEHELGIFRLAIGCEAHHFVFA